jgi:membrane protein
VGWRELLRRTVAAIDEDNCLGLAAQLAFYSLLSLFPALLFVVAMIGYLPIEDVLTTTLEALGAIAPREVLLLLRMQLDEIARGDHGSLLTLGIAGAVWSSSAAMVAVIDARNRAYDFGERRPWWKRRVMAVALTLALSIFIVAALAFVMIGPDLAQLVAAWFGLADVFALLWSIVRWPRGVADGVHPLAIGNPN